VTVKVKGSEASAVTGADGTFTLEAPRAEATLELSGPDHVAKEVVLGARQKSLQVSLTKAAPTQRTITGLVKDSSGKAVAGAVVTIKGTSISASSDSDGLFVLAGAPIGPADLEVSSQDFGGTAVNVPEGQSTVKLELQGGAAPAPAAEPAAQPQGNIRTVRGKVTESVTGEAVPGATVQVVGTSTLAITDEKGEFELADLPNSDVLLEVQSTGYDTVRLSAGAGVANVSAALKFASSEEIVIIGRAPVLMKTNLSNGASVVNDRDLNRVSAQTLDNALTGKVSGANLQTNSGAPGGGTQLRLRGVSTINGQSSPLYVVDGVIISNQAIASGANLITAAAAGGSASNQDNPVNRVADLNPNDIENVEILKGASAAALYGSKAANGVVIITTKRGRAGEKTNVSVTQRVGFSQVSNRLGSRKFRSRSEAIAEVGVDVGNLWDGTVYDHEKAVTRTPVSYETIASASGGTQNGSYAGSVLVHDEPGVLKSTFYQKQSGKLSVGYNFGDKLSVNVSTNLIHSKSDRGLTNNDNTGTSTYVSLALTPSFLNLDQRPDGTFPFNPAPKTGSNPLQTVALLQNTEDVWRLIGSSSAVYKIYSDAQNSFNLQGNFGADRFQQVNELYSPPELQFEANPDGTIGTLLEGTTQNLNYNVGAGAVWTFTPKSEVFRSALSTGFTYESVDLTTVYVQAQNLTGGIPNVDVATVVGTVENNLRTKDQGVYLQEEVALLEDRLTLLAGLLGERSSLNGEFDKIYLFPKVAASYKLPVLEDLFNPVRVRAAYGEAGNRPNYGQKFTALAANNTIDGTGGLVIGGVGGIPTAGDPDIEPERQREVELGIDAAMEDQRVVLELTGYQRSISNLLLQRQLPTSTGFTTQFLNGGSMRNRGVEASLQVIPVTGPVEWTSRANLTLNRSEVRSLPEGIEAFNVPNIGFGLASYRIEPGKSATQIVADVDGDGIEDVVGNGEPDFRVGWSNEVKVGDFGVFGLIDWQQGSDVLNLTRYLYDFGGVSEDYVTAGMDRLATVNAGDVRPYMESATFVKVREVSVYYDLPKSVTSQMGPVNSLRLSLQGRNLLTFTNYSGLDPEVSNFGNQPIGRNIDVAPYPPSRSYWLSVDAAF
jgi:TonB-dependent starch-binding outer membrane protein SusC